MDIFYVLCLLTLNCFAANAFLRDGKSTTCPKITDFSGGKPIKYRRKGTKAIFKCKRKFTKHGPGFAICLDDGTWNDETPLCIKTGCVPLDPSQVNNLNIMEIVNGALVKFTCLENYVLLGETQAYCDGKDWSASLPRCAAPHELLECDFEEDFCGWTQGDSEEHDWVRNVGPTHTANTGPKHDHTYGETGTGHYLLFETSSPAMSGHQASLLSPAFTASLSPICFHFWFHILGPDEAGHVGSLKVFVLDQSQFLNDTDIKPLFSTEGNQGNEWHRGEITIDKQDEPYQIAIVATKALSYNSDIAIDDVRLNNCSKQTSSEPSTLATKTITTATPPKTATDTRTIKSMTTPTTKTSTTITKPIKEITTIKQTTKSSTTVVSKAVTTTVPTFKTTKVYTTDTQPVSSRPSSITKKTKTSKQVMSASTARGSSSSSPMTQKQNSIETKKLTNTQAVTEPVIPSITSAATQTFTTTNKPGTTQKGLAETTTASTKPSSATSIPTTVTFLSTTKPLRSKTITTMPTVSSTSLKSMTVNKSPNTTESTTKSTRVISTKSSRKAIRTSSQTSVFSKIPTTTAESTMKVTTLTSTQEAPFTRTKRPNNTTENTSISVSHGKSSHPENNILKPFIIWLCGGIVAGLIIIGGIAFVCVLRRKFYTSTHEDSPKPITNSASIQSLNS